MSEPLTELTDAEIEVLSADEVEALLFEVPPSVDELIREAISNLRESIEKITRFGIDERRRVIRLLRKQLAYELKTLS